MYNQYPDFMINPNEMPVQPCMRNFENYGMNPMMMPHESMNPMMMQPEPMMMPEDHLTMMYPNTYYIIYPEVIQHCDMYDKECCGMKIPTHEEVKEMAEKITKKVEMEVEANLRMENGDDGTRQFGFTGRGLLRDFALALLLREFFERRHRPHHPRRPFPSPHMGY